MSYDPYWKNWKPDPRVKSPGKVQAPSFRCYPEFNGQSLGQSLEVAFFHVLNVWNAFPADALDELTLLLQFTDVTPPLPHNWRLMNHQGTVAVLAPNGAIRLGSEVFLHARKDVRYTTIVKAGRPARVIHNAPSMTEYYDTDGKLVGLEGNPAKLSQEARRQLSQQLSRPEEPKATKEVVALAVIRRLYPKARSAMSAPKAVANCIWPARWA